MSFKLPDLLYKYNALEPHIDAQTMEIHHTKHHQAYVDKLNDALGGNDELLKLDIDKLLEKIDDVPEDIKTAVINNGGGHANHSLFWEIMIPEQQQPEGEIKDAIESIFTSFDDFKSKFTEAALTRFGSGWAWLVANDGELKIYSTPNQDSPYMEGYTPILGLDVWEHAYYLKYQNVRAKYIESWWNVVNWQKVNENLRSAT